MSKAVLMARGAAVVETVGVSRADRTGIGMWIIEIPHLKPTDKVIVNFAGAPYQSVVKVDGTTLTMNVTNRAGGPVDPLFVLIVEEGG